MLKSQANLTDTNFTYNYAVTGGAIVADALSVINIFKDIEAKNNYASQNGGVMVLRGETYVAIENWVFSYNTAASASVLYFLGTKTNTVTNSSFSNNIATEGNTIMWLFSATTFSNVTVKDNISFGDSTGLFITFSTVTITDSSFYTENLPGTTTTLEEAANTYQVYGCFLSISAGATVTVSNSEFLKGYAEIGGFIYLVGDSTLNLQSTNFERGYATSDGGAIYVSGFKELSVLNCIFSNNTAAKLGSSIYSTSGKTKITKSSFQMHPGHTSIYLDDGTFVGKNITIKNLVPNNMDLIYEVKGGGIYAGDMDSFTLESSMIQNLNFAEKGGALYLETSDASKAKAIPANPVYSVTSWIFSSNKAYYGGAVYIKNVEYVKFTSCTFTNNSAIQSKT